MQLQSVAMNAFSQTVMPDPRMNQTVAPTFDNTAGSPLLHALGRIEEVARAQDKRIADDLKTYARSRSPSAQMLGLLQLQCDLDDMHVNATLAKNIASQFSQALNTLTQRT